MIKVIIMAGLFASIFSLFGGSKAVAFGGSKAVSNNSDNKPAISTNFVELKQSQARRDDQTLAVLSESGDLPSKIRLITHMTFLPNLAIAKEYIRELEQKGYRIDDKLMIEDKGEKLPFVVKFSHEGSLLPDDIKPRTAWLAEIAAKSGGSYDGWETFVVSEN